MQYVDVPAKKSVKWLILSCRWLLPPVVKRELPGCCVRFVLHRKIGLDDIRACSSC